MEKGSHFPIQNLPYGIFRKTLFLYRNVQNRLMLSPYRFPCKNVHLMIRRIDRTFEQALTHIETDIVTQLLSDEVQEMHIHMLLEWLQMEIIQETFVVTAGTLFELDAIAAAYVGGVSAAGGVGKVTGAIIGAIVMASLTSGMNLLGVGIAYQYMIRGAVLALAVIFDVMTRRKASA